MTSIALKSQSSPYETHKEHVLAVLGRRCRWLDPADREAAFHDAYEVYLSGERSGRLTPMNGHELRTFLTRAAINKALDQGKAAERRHTVGFDAALSHPDEAEPVEERVADASERVPVREIVEALTERQRAIIKLRFWLGLSAEQTRGFLRISNRAYRKDFERAMHTVGERYELVREGRWCESRRSLVLAYIAGIAGPHKAEEARMHLAGCPGCARMAAELRRAGEQAAAVLPVPDAALGEGPLHRGGEALAGVRDQLADLGTQGKQQAVGLVARADPASGGNYLAGARPGTVAAAIVGCVAVGGGATYCATEGLPDSVRPVFGLERAEAEREPPDRPRAEPANLPELPVVGPTPPAPEPAPAPPPAPVAPPPEAAPAPAPPVAPAPPPAEQEFGIESQAAAPPAAPAPAPAPPAGGGAGEEFGIE